MHPLRLLLGSIVVILPLAVRAQEPVGDSARLAVPTVMIRVPPVRERLLFESQHPAFSPFGRFAPLRRPASEVADNQAFGMRQALETRIATMWGTTTVGAFGMVADTTRVPSLAPIDPTRIRPDTNITTDIFGDYADLGLQLLSRLEAKGERSKNERCNAQQALNPALGCQGSFQPTFDFQFNVKTGGVVADRVHVNVDYDSEREFDASNNISVYYEGKSDELIERLEVGNVSFAPPSSRFITSGIPSGNYGLQAIGQLGPMRFRTIMAQQKGNVVKDNVFTVGDRTLQAVQTEIEDYKIEPRRFFFTIDPRKWLGAAYPNIDILNAQQMTQLAASLPDSVRPTRVFVYRLQFNSVPQNPNGPQFLINGRPEFQRGPIYEYLREGIDYYIDPSQLWISLVRPASLTGERYVIAYNIGNGGTNPRTGGDPVVQNEARNIFANLIWDPSITPDDSAFTREIRSVYRVGGDDIHRQTVSVRIVTGTGQEKPVAGTAQSYLQMFGLAQLSNAGSFDVENRLWPRPSDPNINASSGGSGQKLIRDYFLVFPSLEPFSRAPRGLAQAGNPANDTIYRTPGEYLYSAQHPQSVYRLRLRYEAEGGGDVGSLALGSVQVRQNSERITVDGRLLTRDTDYTVDYELGRVTFNNPAQLFPTPRQVSVQYEENPLFAAAPTTIFGIATHFPLTNGQVGFTAISQSQKTTFNRPPLGFEPASSLVAGVSGAFQFDASLLTRGIEKLPFVQTTAPSLIRVNGEIATSRPRPNAAGQAYVESFEGEGGITIPLGEQGWYFSSQPDDQGLTSLLGPNPFAIEKASTLVWQNIGAFRNGMDTRQYFENIDPLVKSRGSSLATAPEPMLWLTLYPLRYGGQVRTADLKLQWQLPELTGPRWRSLRTSLSPTGVDLSRIESLEFWTFVDTSVAGRNNNSVLVFDLGDISENSIVFAPESLFIKAGTVPGKPEIPDSVFTGKQLVGFDTLNTERNPVARNFDAANDDVGLPGDRAEITVVDSTKDAVPRDVTMRLCQSAYSYIHLLGDAAANCTIGNRRLDEEDLDQDGQLNGLTPDAERVFRFVVDLRNPISYSRVGVCSATTADASARNNCWVLVRMPFRTPTEEIGNPTLRRVKSLRITMASGSLVSDSTLQFAPLVRFKLVGSPWIKRSGEVLSGIAGESGSAGYVIASIIGTNDYDPSRGLFYESPPGVTDEADTKSTGFETGRIQINERSLRLQAGGLDLMERAEAYYRFPDAQKSFMGYKELRIWARGRNNGWGRDGELDFYVKMGRDANNFYMYRTPANSGDTRAAWQPEVRVQFQRFFDLRARIQNAYLQGDTSVATRITCTGTDLALINAIPQQGDQASRYAACDGEGYMVYTQDPNISPPNLAAVQELAVGMVRSRERTPSTTSPIGPADTLELWVDDIRLTDVEDTPGYAGQFGLEVQGADIFNVTMNMSRKDPYFRQLAEQPSFVTDNAFDISASVRLDKLMSERLGFALPFTMQSLSSGNDPLYLVGSDLQGGGIQGLRTDANNTRSYTLGIYRQAPLQNRWLGPIVNNLRLNGSFTNADSRSAYADGTTNNAIVNLDYTLASQGTPRRLPRWVDRGIAAMPDFLESSTPVQAMRTARYRFSPASFRFSSGMQKSNTNVLSFNKPASSATDEPRATQSLSHLWRNGSALEFRPVSALTARWDILSLRDLRHYGTPRSLGSTSADQCVGCVAEGERERLLGVDIGLERERSMETGFNFVPVVSAWIKPRIDFTTRYAMNRDPNSTTLLQTRDSSGSYRLPRRFSNNRTIALATSVDFARALVVHTSDSSIIRRLANSVQVIDISWNRGYRSEFDGTAFTPPIGYQFALGGGDRFVRVGDRLAAGAGLSENFSVNSGVALPLGLRLSNRYEKADFTTWARRSTNTLGVNQGRNLNFPDVGLQWNYRAPAWLQRYIVTMGGQIASRTVTSTTFTPPEGQSLAQRSWAQRKSLPINGSVAWGFGGGMSTTAGFSTTESRERGADNSLRLGTSKEFSADIGKPLTLPASWKATAPLRTHIGLSRSHTTAYFFSNSVGQQTQRTRSADNGRQTISVNMDTDVAENLNFSLSGSRSTNFDNMGNHRFTQLIVTAVLNLSFFAGELR